MAKILPTQFTSYELSEAEQLSGMYLNLEQQFWIQNNLAKAAELQLALVPDPNNYSAFIQQHASLAGQIQILQYLLDCSDSAVAAQKQAEQENSKQ